MENKGYLEITISGKKGFLPLSPETYDISEIKIILENIEDLLFPQDKKNRPIIAYEIQKGSVKNIFKTSLQAIIGFNAILSQVEKSGSIDFLEYQTAKAFEIIQETAYKQNYSFQISTSVKNSSNLTIDSNTHYKLNEPQWVEAEFYFYGEITDWGGQNKANIHISLPGLGAYKINTPKEFIKQYESNPVYKIFGIIANGRQNIATGEIDKGSLKFNKFLEYNPRYDEQYLEKLINKSTETWSDIKDADEWIHEVRGGSY